MAKQIILYNLRDDVTEEDYVKWCEDYKGPVMLAVKPARNFTLLRLLDGEGGDGQKEVPPSPAKTPYRYMGIMEVGDLEEWAKNTEADEEFSERFATAWFTDWVADFCALDSVELYYGDSD
jgi:hypothetical protein